MFTKIFLFTIGCTMFFSCATPAYRTACPDNFKKDLLTKEDIKQVQYYFYSDYDLVLRRIHLTPRKIEEGVVYKEVKDSLFTVRPNAEGVLRYIYRDDKGVDNLYVGFDKKFRPIPFIYNSKYNLFRVQIEGYIKTRSGSLPAVFLRDEEGQLKEVWVVVSLDKNNKLVYQGQRKTTTTRMVAEGERIGQ